MSKIFNISCPKCSQLLIHFGTSNGCYYNCPNSDVSVFIIKNNKNIIKFIKFIINDLIIYIGKTEFKITKQDTIIITQPHNLSIALIQDVIDYFYILILFL